MDSYRTEDEQVEALKRWWEENGRSTVAAIVIAVAGAFGWQGWKAHQGQQAEAASDLYQALLRARTVDDVLAPEQRIETLNLAQQLRDNHSGSTYAQFAALHLAAMAVEADDLAEAEAQLRWVLGRADKNSDIGRVAQLRLARIVAARGNVDQALAILAEGDQNYQASYAMAQGDILLAAGREDEARQFYVEAARYAAMSGQQAPFLQAKLQRLNPVDPRGDALAAPAAPEAEEVDVIAGENALEPAPAEAAAEAEEGEG